MPCNLCNCATRSFEVFKEREYVQCTACRAIYLPEKYHLSRQAEKYRYILHNNDVNDAGYIQFVSPIIEQVKSDFTPDARGLDFGCGTGTVITSELKKSGYQLDLYDPFFQPNKKLFSSTFNYIVCCEVMEHFQDPLAEFKLLRSLMKPGAKLYCKTGLWKETIDFQNWHYKNDLTHVVFYHEETLVFIKKELNFSSLAIQDDFFILSS